MTSDGGIGFGAITYGERFAKGVCVNSSQGAVFLLSTNLGVVDSRPVVHCVMAAIWVASWAEECRVL